MPYTREKIIVRNNHGEYEATPYAMDVAIRRYLPASPNELRDAVQEIYGFTEGQFNDVSSVSEFLVMLAAIIEAEWRGNG